ncbi:hypothetical protein VPNG_00064 [Cytospora leucostoma]|uniref:Uncharacterized protein n=1 Tax=Cytospora leucostoma TaxID=1230097 RepID=A0A423XP13_9PEZI|nr:hypothetical protein VPNG_00064 [Cytospora leucostoma]
MPILGRKWEKRTGTSQTTASWRSCDGWIMGRDETRRDPTRPGGAVNDDEEEDGETKAGQHPLQIYAVVRKKSRDSFAVG